MSARILIVDDEQLMTAMLAALLSTEGYEVLQAPDGVKATALLAEVTPDVILCDLAMPGMDGFELLQWVRRNPRLRHVPFAIITAHGDIENRMEALQLGADDFILKPFNTTELLAKVGSLVAKVRQARELSKNLEADLAGDLAEISVSDVFHILELSHKTGRVRLSTGSYSGDVYFRDGQPVHAEGDGWLGDDALLRFLTWDEGQFEFLSQETTEERSVTMTTHQILVEGVKFLDSLETWWTQTPKAAATGEERKALLERHVGDLKESDIRIFNEIDDKSTLAEVAERAHADRFEAFTAVRTLISLGLVVGEAGREEYDPLGLLLERDVVADPDRARVLVVDSSAPYRQALINAINSSSALQVIGAVSAGDQAMALIHDRDPSVVTLDLNLPGENGLSLLKRIMVQQPRPVVVVSAFPQDDDMTAFECLRYGAVDFVAKQSSVSGGAPPEQQTEFIERIHKASEALVGNIKRVRLPGKEAIAPAEDVGEGALVAVGSGTGGVGPLIRFLSGLPAGFPASVLIIQHLAEPHLSPFVTYLQRFAQVPVRRAENDAALEPGVCQIACSDQYVNLEPGAQGGPVRLRIGPRPALFRSNQTINWAFFSVAEIYADRVVSLILAGQSEDGSKGAAEIRRTGGGCIVQDPKTSVVPEMPQAAVDLDVAEVIAPDGALSEAVIRWFAEHPVRRAEPVGS